MLQDLIKTVIQPIHKNTKFQRKENDFELI